MIRQPSHHSDSRDPGVLARAWAIRALFRWLRHGEFPDITLERLPVPPELRGFTTDLVYTTVRWHALLDAALRLLVERQPPADAEAALLVGLCQLLRMDGIPAYAAIHATVEAAKVVGNRRTPVGLVNAALRNADHFRRDLEAELASAPPAVRLSHPADLLERWTQRWGAERAEAICRWDNEPARVALCTLPGGPSAATLLERFREAGVAAEPHPGFPDEALLLPRAARPDKLPGFAEGHFAIQDPATLAAVNLLDVRPGLHVLDACAAPGGKAARIARLLGGDGRLVALELHEDRLPRLRETIARLVPGADAFVDILVGDAAAPPPETPGGPFDRILLDVPCSNSGVLRRRPDARWRLDPARLAAVRDTQARILAAAPALLAPGGRLVYSTCSVEEDENEAQIAAFLAAHPDWRLAGERLHLPGDDDADGAYAAALEPAP